MSKFTEQQQDAISAADRNLLVAAGAGSGKTTVLVQRIVRHVEQGNSVTRVLALTFTNAAAAGMRSRVARQMEQEIKLHPENKHLRSQLVLLQQAPIGTIHSFCLDLLRRESSRLALAPNFRVGGELELGLLCRDVMADMLEQEYAQPQSLLPKLADAYGGNQDDSKLAELIESLYNYARSRPNPEQWLADCVQQFAPQSSLDDYAFAEFLATEVKEQLQVAAALLQRAAELCGLPAQRSAQAADEALLVADAANASGLQQLFRQLSGIGFERLKALSKAAKAELDEDAEAEFKALRDDAKKRIKTLQERFCGRSDQQFMQELAELQPLMQELVRLTLRYGSLLSAAKLERNLIDFSDMEHFALQLLQNQEVLQPLLSRYDQILVDEYQDINEVQESILAQLAANSSLFVVGDVKQSIYRFRLAEPALFMDKYRRYGELLGGRRIDLNSNFRSTRAIISGVNFVFAQLMSEKLAEISYDEAASLHPGPTAEQGEPPELHILCQDDSEAALPAMEAEAHFIANRIHQLQEQGFAYGDMAILLRSGKRQDMLIAKVLSTYGIPVLTEANADFLQTPEMQLMQAVLMVIDNPEQDIPLAAVLRSLWQGFSADDLLAIRLAAPEGSYFAALQQVAELEDELGQRCAAFISMLQECRSLASLSSIADLLRHLYYKQGIYHLLGALPQGRRRQANLDALAATARAYDQQGFAGLFSFVQQLISSQELEIRQKAAGAAGNGENAVRIMTMHKSKGLEFPVVFVAGMDRQFNVMDERADIIWERSLGLGARLVEREKQRKFTTLSHLSVAGKLHRLALAEEMRILYVAMTRAEKRLIISGVVKAESPLWDKWCRAADEQELPYYKLAEAKCPLDWLVPALLRHKDGAALRAMAGVQRDILLLPCEHGWQISVENAGLGQAQAAEQLIELPAVDAMLQQQVDAAMDYVYPHAEMCEYPAKWSVSALVRLGLQQQEGEDAVALMPAAEQEQQELLAHAAEAEQAEEQAEEAPDLLLRLQNRGKAAGAAERGTEYHHFLQLVDLANASLGGLQQQEQQMQQQGLLGTGLDLGKIAAFFSSSLGRRYAAAKQVERERAFTMLLPLNEADSVLLQGMLDAAFLEQEGWVLLDYKTGGFGLSNAEILSRYKEQLLYYKQAVSRLFGQPVKESWLCMLDLQRNIAVE